MLLVFRTPEGIELSDILLEVEAEQEEGHDADRVRRIHYHLHASHVFILSNEGQRDEESEEVEEQENVCSAKNRPVAPVLEERQDEGVHDITRLPG